MTFDIFGNGPSEFQQTQVRRVTGAASVQRVDRGFPYTPRRDEVGFTYAETDYVFPGRDNLEEVPNAGAGHRPQVLRDVVTGRL